MPSEKALNKTPIHPLLATSDGQPAAITEAAAALLTAPSGTLVGGDGMPVGTPKEVPRRTLTRMCIWVGGHGWHD